MTGTNRKLTTIFLADVQGYSRLMGADEEGTLATLKSYRDAMARLIGAHGGRVVNTWGDGLIAEFPSVVEAVRAAVDVQNELGARNASRAAESRMDFRIGINLGDVIADGDDLYGDGVNVAARLQASAEPGGIIISSTVHDQVRNKLSVGFDFLGDLTVKNIDEAIPSYAVRVGAPRAWGRNAGKTVSGQGPKRAAQADRSAPGRTLIQSVGRRNAILGLAAIVLVAINAFGSSSEFWAKWPLLAFATVAGMGWAASTKRIDRRLASFAVIGAALVAINLFAWDGAFWAVWPLMAMAFALFAGWILRRAR